MANTLDRKMSEKPNNDTSPPNEAGNTPESGEVEPEEAGGILQNFGNKLANCLIDDEDPESEAGTKENNNDANQENNEENEPPQNISDDFVDNTQDKESLDKEETVDKNEGNSDRNKNEISETFDDTNNEDEKENNLTNPLGDLANAVENVLDDANESVNDGSELDETRTEKISDDENQISDGQKETYSSSLSENEEHDSHRQQFDKDDSCVNEEEDNYTDNFASGSRYEEDDSSMSQPVVEDHLEYNYKPTPPTSKPNSARTKLKGPSPLKDYPFVLAPLDPTIQHVILEDNEIFYEKYPTTLHRTIKARTSRSVRVTSKPLAFERSPYFQQPFQIFHARPPPPPKSARTCRAPPPAELKFGARFAKDAPTWRKPPPATSDYLERKDDADRRTAEFDHDMVKRWTERKPCKMYHVDHQKVWEHNLIDNKNIMLQREKEEYQTHVDNLRRKRIQDSRKREQLRKQQQEYEMQVTARRQVRNSYTSPRSHRLNREPLVTQ